MKLGIKQPTRMYLVGTTKRGKQLMMNPLNQKKIEKRKSRLRMSGKMSLKMLIIMVKLGVTELLRKD